MRNKLPQVLEKLHQDIRTRLVTKEDINRMIYLYQISRPKSFNDWILMSEENNKDFKELTKK